MSLPLAPLLFSDEIDFLPNKALMLYFFILIALPNDPAPPLDDVDIKGKGAALSEPPDLDDAVVETDNRWFECLLEGVEGVCGTDHKQGKTAVLGLASEAPGCKRDCGLEVDTSLFAEEAN